MEELCKEISKDTQVILAEARTANPGGWKVARKAGFIPIGIEPLAHNMFDNLEPMIVLSKISPHTLKYREENYVTTVETKKISQVVSSFLNIQSPSSQIRGNGIENLSVKSHS